MSTTHDDRPTHRAPAAAPRRRRWSALVLVAALSCSLAGLVSPRGAAASEGFDPEALDPGLPRVARIIDFSTCVPTCATSTARFPVGKGSSSIELLDAGRRLVYGYNPTDGGGGNLPRGVLVFDADRMVQTGFIDLSQAKLPSDRFTMAALDPGPQTHRMFFAEPTATGCSSVSASGCAVPSKVAVLDLDRPTVAGVNPVVFSLPTPTELAGRVVTGATGAAPEVPFLGGVTSITYDPTGRRLLLLVSTDRTFDATGAGADPQGVAVVSYDASPGSLTSTTKPAWIYAVRACPAAVMTKSGRAAFARAKDGTFVYFPCHGVIGGAAPHGVVRLNFGSAANNDPSTFSTDWYPFAGNFLNGSAIDDEAGERVALLVGAVTGVRTYFFDARHGAWTGSLLFEGGNPGGGGANPVTGRMYVLHDTEGMRYIDNAFIPPIVGSPLGIGYKNSGLHPDFVVDPITSRIWYHGENGFPNSKGTGLRDQMWVYQDVTPSYAPAEAADPDARTHDIAEADAVQVDHTAFGSAYGAHVMSVGGTDAVPFVYNTNKTLGATDQTRPLRLSSGDRGLFLGQVDNAELSGDNDTGYADASAVAARIDEATASDLTGKYDATAGRQCRPPTDGGASAPSPGCVPFESVLSNVGELSPSVCKDLGGDDDPRDAEEPGSSVACRRLDQVTASATSTSDRIPQAGPITFDVQRAESHVTTTKNPDGGVTTVSTALAHGVSVEVPGVGSLSIGEVRSTATATAKGRPGTASSSYTSMAKDVLIADASGTPVFSCGVTGVDAKAGEDGEQCSSGDMVLAINRFFAPRLVARGPRQQLDPSILGSPGGARAIVEKELFAYYNDTTINGDAQREVTGLDLELNNDFFTQSRETLQLAGTYAEAQYAIGQKKLPRLVEPSALTVHLIDGDGAPLAGGLFEVRKASTDESALNSLAGDLLGSCATGTDGVGTCSFTDVAPGDYVVTETAAPTGYAAADDVPLTIGEGSSVTVEVTNLKSIGTIKVRLTDDGSGGKAAGPLPGATFEAFADDGDLAFGSADKSIGTCTTDADGTCEFSDVPLGPYVVRETTAPPGYLKADDVGFKLEQPGQIAELSFVTGVEGVAGTDASPPVTATDDSADQGQETARVDAPTDTTTVVIQAPAYQPVANVTSVPIRRGRGAASWIGALPGDAARFLHRHPGQAVLFALVWLLFGAPFYLAVRRRTLVLVKEVA